jgi:hypothetical protein
VRNRIDLFQEILFEYTPLIFNGYQDKFVIVSKRVAVLVKERQGRIIIRKEFFEIVIKTQFRSEVNGPAG